MMTEREFFTKVIATQGIDSELVEHAKNGIAKLDAKNEKRKNTESKTQKENKELMTQMIALFKTNGAMVASEIGTALGVSTQKASSLCQLLVKDNTITVADRKVKGKGAVKEYTLAEVEGE